MEQKEINEIIDTTFITLLVTKKCNLNCWYCDVGTDKYSRMFTRDDMSKVIQFINNTEKHNVVLHFFGGEPTLNHDLLNFFQMAREGINKNLDILLTTNLQRDYIYYESLPTNIHVTASYHHEYVQDSREWFQKALLLKEKGILYRVVLMATRANIEALKEINGSYDIPMLVVPIDQHIDDPIFTENFDNLEPEEKEIFFDKTALFMCSSGLIIMENGDVHYCWERMNEPVFNVLKAPDTKISPWHVCKKYSTNCDAEVVRCSFAYYNSKIRDRVYSKKKNSKVLFRCNG